MPICLKNLSDKLAKFFLFWGSCLGKHLSRPSLGEPLGYIERLAGALQRI
jgi:hypothetical protein